MVSFPYLDKNTLALWIDLSEMNRESDNFLFFLANFLNNAPNRKLWESPNNVAKINNKSNKFTSKWPIAAMVPLAKSVASPGKKVKII